MTRLVCVCGAVIEGSEEELLKAVESHLAEAHLAARRDPSAQPVVRRETAGSDCRSTAETEEA